MLFHPIELVPPTTDSNVLAMSMESDQYGASQYWLDRWHYDVIDQGEKPCSHVVEHPAFPCGFGRGQPGKASLYGWHSRTLHQIVDSRDWQDGSDPDGPHGGPNCDLSIKWTDPPTVCEDGEELVLQAHVAVPEYEIHGTCGAQTSFLAYIGDGTKNANYVVLLHDTRSQPTAERIYTDPAQADLPVVSCRLAKDTRYSTLRHGHKTVYGHHMPIRFFRVHFSRENLEAAAEITGIKPDVWRLKRFGIHIEFWGLDGEQGLANWLRHEVIVSNLGAWRYKDEERTE